MESIAYEDALRIVLAQCRPLPSEIVGISQSGGRVLARSFRAREDDPPQPKSGMDGFALQSKDTAPATPERPITLSFDEVVGAGHQALREVAPGQAVRIMTGALLPPGADAVVKQEHTRSNGPGRFSVTVPLNPGQNVVPVGAHLRAGTLLQEAGEVLTPHGVSLLAGQGLAQIPVHRRPRVGLLALGDELVVPGGELAPGQIFVSNPYLLEALAREAGAEPVLLGVVPDSLEVIEARLRQALGGGQGQPPCEVVVTLGGSHLGDFDFGWKVQDRLGAQVRFQRVRLNIGGSSLFGTLGDALCFGLPGPPPAAWIGFETLVRPALLKLGARTQTQRPQFRAALTVPMFIPSGRMHFIPARLYLAPDQEPRVTPLPRGVALPRPAHLLANALIRVGEEGLNLTAGEGVTVDWLEIPAPPLG